MQLELEQIFNFASYPFHRVETTAYNDLILHARTQLAKNGACEFPNFLTQVGLAALITESQKLATHAYFNTVVGNAYLEAIDPTWPAEHPRARTEHTSLGVIAYDEYPTSAILRRIYEYEPLMHFIGAIFELNSIYRYADPMGGLNLSVMADGDYLRWHFDQTDFVTSIAIQTAEKGGEFEFVPLIRSSDDEHYDDVNQVLDGVHPCVQKIANHPGTLLLFKGRHSIHRVSTIRGRVPRLMGLLAYDEKPDVISTDHLRKIRYGRTTAYEQSPYSALNNLANHI